MSDDIPKSVSEGTITISGITLKTYVLEDGTRLIDVDDLHLLLAEWERGCPEPTETEAAEFRRFFGE